MNQEIAFNLLHAAINQANHEKPGADAKANERVLHDALNENLGKFYITSMNRFQ